MYIQVCTKNSVEWECDQGQDKEDSDAKTVLTQKPSQYQTGPSRRVNAVLEKIIYWIFNSTKDMWCDNFENMAPILLSRGLLKEGKKNFF